MSNDTQPEIRFPGFTDDWEERKLKDIFDIHTDFVSNGSFQALKDNVKLYKTENYAYMIRLQDASNNWSGPWLYTDKQGFDFLSKSMVYKDDILMSDRGTIGKFFLVPQLDKPMTLSSNAVLLRSTKNDNNFIYYMLNTSNISNQIIVRTTPGVQPMISKTEFKKINTRIPNIQEQQKIGSFFKQLDNTIALHQRKLDLLKETKKGFLQKMFPKNGAKVPEIRFPGFTGDWEERKLTELATTYIGLVTTMTKNYTESGTLLIRNSDIKEGKFDLNNPIYLKEDFAEQNKTRRMRNGDVVTVHTGDIGTSAVITEDLEGTIGFATITTRPSKELDSNFLSWYFNSNIHKKYARRMSTGDGRSNYNMKDFNKNVIAMPAISEQQKIGTFFKQLNDTITLHQRELDVLKETKKGFLQKMFV
ncbi:restriction endonuclease subunit S [Enterococcus faecium]|uniref:restriction endonuclease subunit S n=2 Tax=Enterococcus faecium TaxID=1352 RepID=UPI000BF5C8C8|nr:restriction endonuclease subunit S [Enterococcus faecium]EMF0259602.1 restriction endonuclease subunit S [Enterococcus hirae]EGP5482944.1 restriction endonuclease subunit S [Enterococcus faecium]EME7132119.1 restriction endonuclease subunit S [Enterococcus faecium]EME8170924.1 restriction endonuclease subunit S [Enterococcus faecium]EME8188856.1 restriction endonuclease subunit S [Enterococcus faecium]